MLIYKCNQLLRIVAREVVFFFAFVGYLHEVVPARSVNFDQFSLAEVEETTIISEKSYSGKDWYHQYHLLLLDYSCRTDALIWQCGEVADAIDV